LDPKDNERCAAAVQAYRACLVDDETFAAWTLEDVVAAIRTAGAARWIDAFDERYLDFASLDGLAE
jgi:hypothetical protein